MASEFIEILSPSALKDLQTANVEVLTLIKNIDNAGKSMQNIKTPSGSDSAVKNLNTSLIQQEKLLQRQQKALEKARLAEIKIQQAREKAIDSYSAKEAKEIERLNASQNIYNKIQQKINSLSNEYKALATRKELGIQLTDKEAQRYTYLQGKIQTYDKTLKAVDATMGKHQRNVGNYASAFNPLSNSINQLTREMPAFTYSVQTGFMALSNNIPIFTDAIGNAIAQNKALQKEGKPTTSVLSQLASSFLSWQTLMGVGITLLTVYGKEIGEFISKTFKASEGINSIKESQKQLNEINQEGAKNAVEETLNLKSLLSIAKDTNLSYKERMIAVNELQDTYPSYFGNLEKEQILAGNTATAERDLTEAILSRAKANAAVAKITENQGKIIDFELQRLDLRKELKIVNDSILLTEKRLQNSNNVSTSEGIVLSQMYDKKKRLIKDINELSGEKHQLDEISNALTNFAIEKQKESILLKYKEEKAIKNTTNANKQNNREVSEAIELETDRGDSILLFLEAQIDKVKKLQKNTSENNEDWVAFQKIIDTIQISIDRITKGESGLEDFAKKSTDEFKKLVEQMFNADEMQKKLFKNGDDYLKMFSDDFIKKSGFEAFFDIVNGKLNTFGDNWKAKLVLIVEATQEFTNFMMEQSNKRFENEYANLQKEKEISLLFAGDSATAKEEIERQYQERQRAIKQREAKAKQKQAIFNIVIDTAQGILGALSQLNIPLSIAIGAIGALQIGMVASQQIPQFWKGTDNAPEGFAWTQEKGAETITDKNGRIKTKGSNKGAQLTYLSKGDKVYTAEQTQLMHNNTLNGILTSNGITPAQTNTNITNVDMSGVINAIENKKEVNLSIDKNGLDFYIKRGSTNAQVMNRRVNFSGLVNGK